MSCKREYVRRKRNRASPVRSRFVPVRATVAVRRFVVVSVRKPAATERKTAATVRKSAATVREAAASVRLRLRSRRLIVVEDVLRLAAVRWVAAAKLFRAGLFSKAVTPVRVFSGTKRQLAPSVSPVFRFVAPAGGGEALFAGAFAPSAAIARRLATFLSLEVADRSRHHVGARPVMSRM